MEGCGGGDGDVDGGENLLVPFLPHLPKGV